MNLRRNVLIFHLGALGDFIVTWPIALALARLYPQSRVFYVTHSQKGALAEKVLRVESLDIEGGWERLFSEEADLPAAAARALAGAHTIVSFLGGDNDRWARNVRRANPDAQLIPLTTNPPADDARHISEFLADQLRPWPVVQTAAEQILRSVNERGVGSLSSATGPVIIHPGSGAARKNWPPAKFLELARRLTAGGGEVKIILGEVELEQWTRETIASFEAAAEVVRPISLSDLLSQIASASAFVGNDSGPSHLAGILGLATVSIFGPTSHPVRWKPLGPRVEMVAGPLEQIACETVLEAMKNAGMKN